MIGSLDLSTSSLSLSSLLQTGSSSSSTGSTSAAGGCSQSGDTADLSGPAKLFAELKELATEDPDKFKTVAADIANKLEAAAGKTSTNSTTSSTDGASATGGTNSFLANLAAKFQQAANTGDVSVLQPPSGGGGSSNEAGTYNRHGHMHHSSSGSTDGSNSGGTDLKSLFDSISQEVTAALGS